MERKAIEVSLQILYADPIEQSVLNLFSSGGKQSLLDKVFCIWLYFLFYGSCSFKYTQRDLATNYGTLYE